MSHPLDRAVWNALNTRLSRFTTADSDARAVRIDPEVGVFVSGADASPETVSAMAELALRHPNAGMVELTGGPMAELDLPGVEVVSRIPLIQMACKALMPGGSDLAYETLTEADAPEMLALAILTKPGPFRSRTRELGPFIGVKSEGRLVAMAGRRLRVDGFTELSGVCTHPDHRGKGHAAGLSRAVVGEILTSLGVTAATPQIEVWNKLDLMEDLGREALLVQAAQRPEVMPVSALTGEGIAALLERISDHLAEERREEVVALAFQEGRRRAWLHDQGVVLAEEAGEEGWRLSVRWTDRRAQRFSTI